MVLLLLTPARASFKTWTIDFETPATGSTLGQYNTTLNTPYGLMTWDAQGTFYSNPTPGPLQNTSVDISVNLPTSNVLRVWDDLWTGSGYTYSYDYFYFHFPVYGISGDVDNLNLGSQMQIEAFDRNNNYLGYYLTNSGAPTGYFSFSSPTVPIYKLQVANINKSFLGLDNITLTVIPEPTSVAIFCLLGAMGMAYRGRRRRED